jgi:flagellar basal-body rod protein FlgB
MSIFGIHESALMLREKRSSILASNLAHADTPNYKARDIDFNAILTNKSAEHFGINTSHPSHIEPFSNNGLEVKYRNPTQHSFDKNTVDSQLEEKEFAENSLKYLASLNFIKGKSNTLSMILKEVE